MNIIEDAPPSTAGVTVRAFHPNLVTGRFHATWDFYTEHLGFRTVAEWEVYVHLAHPSGAQLGILQQEIDGELSELISGTDGRGFWLSLDVDDVEAEFERLSAAGVPIVAPPTVKPWGERLFVVRDPNGVLIFIAQRVAACRNGSIAELAAAG